MARELKEHELASPVDLPGDPIEGSHPFGYAAVAIIVAALVLLCANAGALSGWIDERDPTPAQQQASDLANRWTATMDAAGVTAPRAALHARWKQAQAARFGDELPTGAP